MAKQQIGKLSSRALEKQYWRGAGEDLVTLEYAERAQRRKGCLRWYRILKALPNGQDLDTEIRDHYTRPITEWIKAVEEELIDLCNEMGEWTANIQAVGLDSTMKGQEVDDAYTGLRIIVESFEGGQFDSLSDSLDSTSVAVDPRALFVSCRHRSKKKRTGRRWRAREVCSILDAIEKAVREKKSPNKRAVKFADLIHGVVQELEDIDFPNAF